MKKVALFGEIMLRLKTPEFLRFSQANVFEASFGGGEANVAVSLANYGIPTHYVTALPGNDLGKSVIMDLRRHGVGTEFVLQKGSRLGIYYLEAGAVSRASKVIYDRENSAFAELKPGMLDWDKILEDVQWFHWTGITPAVSEGAAAVCLEALKAASAKGITISTDLNYRKNLWKWGKKASEVMPELVEHCDVILGNEEDAEMVFGIHPAEADVVGGKVSHEDFEHVCKELMKKFPKAKKVIITLRGSISASHNSWSGVLYNGKKLYVAPVYQITHIVDRVGGGDSFMGGLIYGLITYNDDQKALNFATAASCLKHTIQGDFNLVTVEEVEKLMAGDASGRVSR
jgi:2-dehydro-3-deoxygluconokinase